MDHSSGFTLLDFLLGTIIAVLLGAIAVPVYTTFVDRANQAQSIADIYEIQLAIDRFNADTFAYPDSLNDLADLPQQDPWGANYRYLRISGNPAKGIKGQQRKDKNLNPLNSDYDLYSVGKDGATKLPLTAKDARDDIIRAGNGGFVGLAEEH